MRSDTSTIVWFAMTMILVTICCASAIAEAMTGSLAEGLILHYSFDTDNGEHIRDSSDRGNHGRNRGSTWQPNAKRGCVRSFDGQSYIRLPDESGQYPRKDFTISLWSKSNILRD